MKYYEKIKKIRKDKDLSQQQLAEMLGMNKSYYSRIETGKIQPSIDFLKSAAIALEVSMDYLMDEEIDNFAPIQIEDKNLMEKVQLIDKLDLEEKNAIIKIIDALLTKKKVVDLVMKEITPTN